MPFLNPKLGIDFSDYIADRTINFTGREWVFEAIQNWLKDTNGDRFFLLTGEPGSGKTAIAARLTQFAQGAETYPGLAGGFLQAAHFCSARDSVWTNPMEFACSLALQLAASIPEFGLALKDIGEKTTNINVDLTVGTAQNSDIKGVVIQNLTLSGLTGQDAFTQVVVNPLRQIRQEGFSQPVTILVDSLDEALTHDNDVKNTIVYLLSRLSDEAKLRLILTSRNEGRVKEKLREYTELFISADKHLDENAKDVRTYVENQFKREETLQNILQAEALDPKILTESLMKKSEGNFLYVRFLLESVASGQQSFGHLASLPQGLDELYYYSLVRVVELGSKDWSEMYAPVMGVLLAAQESLTEGQIRAFTKLKESVVWGCLNDLQQFLDKIEVEDEETQYKLYHQSVMDFLSKRQLILQKEKEKTKLDNRYYLPEGEQHQRLLVYYRPEDKPWDEVQLEKIDSYGRRHLAQHLVKGDRVEELHILLGLENDGKNIWFNVKNGAGDTSGFLADLELAWLQADEIYSQDRGKCVGLQCRYALMKSSINSLAIIPSSLMTALVKHQHWTLTKALAYTLQISYPAKRFESLIALADLSGGEPLKDQILQFALIAVQKIQDEYWRALSLEKLVNKLPADLLLQAQEAIQVISRDIPISRNGGSGYPSIDDVSSDDVSRSLATELTIETLPQILENAQAIQNEFARTETLTALVEPLEKLDPKKLPLLLKAMQAIQDKSSCDWALGALADNLKCKELLAFENPQAIQDDKHRSKAIVLLADKLEPNEQLQALKAAQAIQDSFYRSQALMALANRQTDLWSKTLEASQFIQNFAHRIWILMALADKLPSDLFSQSLESIEPFLQGCSQAEESKSEYQRLRSMMVKTPEALPQALVEAGAIQHEFYRAQAVVTLIDMLTPEALPPAIKAVQETESEYFRSPALTALISHLIKAPNCFILWKELWHFLSYRPRPDLLSDLADLAPVVLSLGDRNSLEVKNAIQDVSRWWP